eukprot:355627-Chlamydomonas_euryale.AAC.4
MAKRDSALKSGICMRSSWQTRRCTGTSALLWCDHAAARWWTDRANTAQQAPHHSRLHRCIAIRSFTVAGRMFTILGNWWRVAQRSGEMRRRPSGMGWRLSQSQRCGQRETLPRSGIVDVMGRRGSSSSSSPDRTHHHRDKRKKKSKDKERDNERRDNVSIHIMFFVHDPGSLVMSAG